MLIAIIAAMQEEIVFLLHKTKDLHKNTFFPYDFYEGKIGKHQVVIVKGGVGKTASGMLISSLVNKYPDVSLIVNVGVAGGVRGKVNVGDIVVNESTAYGDVDITTAGDYAYGQMSGCPRLFAGDEFIIQTVKSHMMLPCKIGCTITTDKFMTNAEEIERLILRYFSDIEVLCFEMESAAFAQSCFVYNKAFISIRAISDVIGENLESEFAKNLDEACMKSNLFIHSLLEII
jgi:adenosylhomocysteine nucleosidase